MGGGGGGMTEDEMIAAAIQASLQDMSLNDSNNRQQPVNSTNQAQAQ